PIRSVRLPLAFRRRVRANESRRDVVDGDVPWSQLVRELPGEPDLCRLRRGVRLDAGEADSEARAAGDVDDPTRARLLHSRRNRLGAVERAGDVDVEDALPVARRDLLERAADLAEHSAGVVDEDVDASARSRRLTHECLDGVLVRHVHDARRAAPASLGACGKTLRLTELGLDDVASPDSGTSFSKR